MTNRLEGTKGLSSVAGSTKGDSAYREIRRRILDGTLPPDSQLDQEEIALALGTSTTPVREAIRRLEAESLVISNAYRKVRVASLSEGELQQIYALRLVLDPLAALWAVEHAERADIDLVVSLASQRFGSSRSDGEQILANRTFHRAIYVASRNDALIEILDSMWDRTDRYRSILFRTGLSPRFDEDHQAIADAFQSGNGELLAELTRLHIASSAQLIPVLTRGGLSESPRNKVPGSSG